MNIEGFLLTSAQVAVALAGFAALISAFRRRDNTLSASEIAGRSMILELGLAAGFFGLLPFPIDAFLNEFNLVGVWRICSLILVIFLTVWGVYNYRRAVNVAVHDGLSNGVQMSFNIVLIVINASLIANILIFGIAALYMAGVLYMLVAGGVQFMIFVYQYAQQS